MFSLRGIRRWQARKAQEDRWEPAWCRWAAVKRADSARIPAFIIRAPQKYQVANYGLAVSYDFMTGLSTGILHGTGVVNRRADFPLWPKTPSAELFDAIESSAAMSAEPLYLPVVLLQHHLYRSREFCTVYMDKFYNEIQAGLGMSRAGRLHGMGEYEDPIGDKSINETRVSLRNLTGELNTLMTEAIWFSQVSEWHLEYANFLSDALGDLFRKAAAPEGTEQRAIRETIAYLGTCARGLRRQTNAAKERAAADFNIVRSHPQFLSTLGPMEENTPLS